jgi:hypothetical protein
MAVAREWKVVPEFPSYEVSSDAFVRNIKTGRLLSSSKNKCDGRFRVMLWKNNKNKLFLRARLVAHVFIGIPHGMTVNHKDGNYINDEIENLEVITQSENNWHKVRVLKKGLGEDIAQSKLKEFHVSEIKSLIKNRSESLRSIARKYGVAYSTVWAIKDGRNWKHI